MEIITNRLKFTFHFDNIKNDFIFLAFKRIDNNGRWWGAKVLDYLLGEQYKALAVCYTEKYAFAMFKKQENNAYQLITRLRNYSDDDTQENEKKEDFTVNEVEIKNLNIDNEENFIDSEALARLLLNYLGSSRSKYPSLQFSNLTGCLLKVPSLNSNKLYKSIQVGEVNLNYNNNTDNEFLLNVSMATYRLKIDIFSELKTATGKRKIQVQKYLNRPQYVIYDSNNILRRWLERTDTNDPKKTYIKAGKNGKKAHEDFIIFKNIDDFKNSRGGILHQVINEINEHLNKYITVEFIPLKIDECIEFDSKNLIFKKPEKLHYILDNQRINIVDLVKDETSQELVNDIQELLKPYFKDQNLISINNHEIEGVFNVLIIHDKNYYQCNKIEDQYLLSDSITPRQNLTIESVKKINNKKIDDKKLQPIIKTLIKELIIKQDISRKKISLFEWSNLVKSSDSKTLKPSKSNFQKNTQLSLFDAGNSDDDDLDIISGKKWIFGMYQASNNDKENKDTSTITFMTINHDGSFEFENLDTRESLFNDHKYQDYHNYIEQAIFRENKTKSSFQFEGFVMSDSGDINLIFRSDEITLPPLQEIESLFKKIDEKLPEELKDGVKLADIVEKFLQLYPNLKKEKFDAFCEQLKNNYAYDISKKELYNLIQQYLGSQRNNNGKISYTANTDEATKFRDYLLEKYQVRFRFPKDNEILNSLFANSLNINYFGETDTEAYYFVGDRTDQIQTSFKDACHIRKIIAIKGCKLIFRDLLKTMDVDFVRTGQSTVIPFPFKYIRESHNLNY
ncbi:hypothetical protein [Geminocystis sp.]|uniref:hypothetical protein n=1 Tax=Geminocystis sp. TaxID=2664100 RepID=UPI003593D8C0